MNPISDNLWGNWLYTLVNKVNKKKPEENVKEKVNNNMDMLHELRDTLFNYYMSVLDHTPKHYTADVLMGINDSLGVLDKFINEKEKGKG